MTGVVEKIKLSEVTQIYPKYDGENRHLIVSNLSGASIIVDDEMKEMLERLKRPTLVTEFINTEYEEVIKQLFEAEFILDATTDGFSMLERKIAKAKACDELDIIPIVTTACNMACPYCFEERGAEQMSSELIDRMVQYTTERMDQEGIKRIYSSLFGGEPLLNFEACKEWVEKIAPEVEKRDGVLKIALITNGTLLTQEILDFLAQYNLLYVQITMDGAQPIHDQRRIFNNGKGSYDILIEKMKMVVDSNLNLQLRINIDNQNHPHIPELMADLIQHGLNRPNVSVALERVMSNTETNASYCSNCIPIQHYDETILPYAIGFKKAGFNVHLGETNPVRPIYCNAYAGKHIAVAPNGDLYSCLDGVGDERYVVGNIWNEPMYNERYHDWNALSTLNFEKCRQCDAVGFCGGGCGAESLNKFGTLKEEPICPPLKWSYVGGVVLPADLRKKIRSFGK